MSEITTRLLVSGFIQGIIFLYHCREEKRAATHEWVLSEEEDTINVYILQSHDHEPLLHDAQMQWKSIPSATSFHFTGEEADVTWLISPKLCNS